MGLGWASLGLVDPKPKVMGLSFALALNQWPMQQTSKKFDLGSLAI